MKNNLVRWATAVGAIAQILEAQAKMMATQSYFERLRIANDLLGPNWVFRLVDTVGIAIISRNRPSWVSFYVDDHDGLHSPLDPGAPETLEYLGTKYSAMDMSFYAGMGFNGYRLALQTQRLTDSVNGTIEFDERYQFSDKSIADMCEKYQAVGSIEKVVYYDLYAQALDALYEKFEQIRSNPNDTILVEQTACAMLLLMCGGHKGCAKHRNHQERFDSQIESLVIFSFAKKLATGEINLRDALNVTAEVS